MKKDTREKFKRWNAAVDKLSEQDKRNEAESWIAAAVNILKEINECPKNK